jgi:transposase
MPRRDPSQPSKAKVYSDEFKRNAVQLVTEQNYSIAAAARAVGVSEPSLRQWVGKHGGAPGETGPASTLVELRQENKRLKQALKRAEMEREILKRRRSSLGSRSEARLDPQASRLLPDCCHVPYPQSLEVWLPRVNGAATECPLDASRANPSGCEAGSSESHGVYGSQ